MLVTTAGTVVALALFSRYATAKSQGHSIWDRVPGVDWYTSYYLIGNGYMGISTNNDPIIDQMDINLDTLWTGGPFNNSVDFAYTGGNPNKPFAPEILENVRSEIFANGNASVAGLQITDRDYGSLTTAGWFYAQKGNTSYTDYKRWLSMEDGYTGATWKADGVQYNRSTFCSYPDQVCVYQSWADKKSDTIFGFNTVRPAATAVNGMKYAIQARCSSDGQLSCDSQIAGNATLVVSNATSVTCILAGDTEYDINAGTSESGYSFAGNPYLQKVKETINKTSLDYSDLWNKHHDDHCGLYGGFELDLGAVNQNESATTQEQINAFTIEQGNTYLEQLIFNMGRYLLIASARGYLPASLQGIWTGAAQQYYSDGEVNEFNDSSDNGKVAPNGSYVYDTTAEWGSDYHANINIQMNYWPAESTNLGQLTPTLWDLIQKTFMPRGEETAAYLYNSSGWVIHDEMNPFGYTGMKLGGSTEKDQISGQQWSDFTAAGAWLMQHVWDHYLFGSSSGDFLAQQGWPMIKGSAQFWLDNLFEDKYFNDGTLVAAPCNSPEQPTHLNSTFGCAMYGQLISQLFESVIQGYQVAGETDMSFVTKVNETLPKVWKGADIGSWGQIKEWKIEADNKTDTHRHISHLWGMYPGSSLASWTGDSPSKSEIYDAVATSIEHRGNATHYGWAKMHRAAVYASLGNASYAHHLYKYMISEDLNGNLLDIYWQKNNSVFQIDANGGAVGYIMNTIADAPAPSTFAAPLAVNLLQAIPDAWSTGSVKNARLRGGIAFSGSWSNGTLQEGSLTMDRGFQSFYVIARAPSNGNYIVKREGWMNPGDNWQL